MGKRILLTPPPPLERRRFFMIGEWIFWLVKIFGMSLSPLKKIARACISIFFNVRDIVNNDTSKMIQRFNT